MSYSFCFGPSGSGKSHLLRQMIIQEADRSLAARQNDRTRYIIIVPEQYSMQTQRDLVLDHPSGVLMNIDVLSFGRLAHRVFEETGADRRTVLDDIGKSLLLRRVASRCAGELQVLHRGIHSPGMIDEIKSILSEFMQYGIEEEEIERMADYAREHGQIALQARLRDLKLLNASFRQAKKDQYVTSEETLDLLAKAIPDAGSLRGSVIVFDGFTGFTTVQYRVVLELIRCAKKVYFAFTASHDQGPDVSLTAGGGPAGREEDLFYMTRRTVYDIIRMASKEGLARGEDIYLPQISSISSQGHPVIPRFAHSPVLSHLESRLFRYPELPYAETKSGETAESLQLFAAGTPQEEVRQIFARIRSMIARTGCAYRDFAIVTADLETYGDLFEREAQRCRIPVYIDRTSGVFHNILVEGIRSVLQISTENYSYAAVFRYLRSGLSSLSAEETDLLENYCLANGVRGRKKWTAPFDAACEEARIRFLKEVAPVTGDPAGPPRRARTAAVRTAELYEFLVGCGAQARMAALAETFGNEGDVVREKQYSQIYRAVIDLLDQVYDLEGQERMSARDYMELIEAGFSQIRLGTLPQRVDRILVGDIERTRLTQIRNLFFAGVNEGNIPRSTSRGGILSDMDREFLVAGGIVLAPTPRQQMFTQRLYLYLNMTKPSDTLTVSFSRTSQDGGSLRPSYLISVLRSLFPALRVEIPDLLPAAEKVSAKEDGLQFTADMLRRFVEGSEAQNESFMKEFTTLYGFFTSAEVSADPGICQALSLLRRAALFRYRPEFLQKEAARALYGNRIVGGISRMETGAKCLLFQHLRYGLHLKERDLYEFAPVDGGTLMHAVLQRFDALLQENGLTWRSFTREDALRLSEQALKETAASYRNLILYKSARDENRLHRYQRRLLRTVDTLQYQLMQGDLLPAASELSFGGADGQMPEIHYALGNGRHLDLIGRIDRVDLAIADNVRYLRIIDYKSSRNDLREDLIRRGLQLQLILYMQALLESGPANIDRLARNGHIPLLDTGEIRENAGPGHDGMIPSAMVYYRRDDPVIELPPGDALSLAAADGSSGQGNFPESESPEAEIAPHEIPDTENPLPELPETRKLLKPTGLVYQDDESISHMDRTLLPSVTSQVIPVGLKKDGGYTAASRVINEEDYKSLSAGAVEVLCRLANSILDGEITASPAVIDSRTTACDYCPYSASCGFDPRTPGYSRRRQ